MTITAKYPGTCRKCGKPIRIGDKVNWEKGKGTEHADCATAPEPLYNSPPPSSLVSPDSDLDALAAKHGRTRADGATLKTYAVYGLVKGDNGDPDGTIHRSKGRRILQVARTARRYLSRDWLEDMDMFGCEPGGSYEWQGFEVMPNEQEQAEDAERARKAAEEKAAKDAKAAAKKAEEDARIAWVKAATAGLTQVSVPPAEEYTRGEYGLDRTYQAIAGNGWTGWKEEWTAHDDWRTYYYLPAEQAKAACLAHATKHNITPEAATEWLEKYSGCCGSEVYRAVVGDFSWIQ